ncbi:MAG: hypothetical protein HY537_05510 [Deltaproteobacteria bacterium]|nr:hypothetical protein [Deltaproteobacteria bacterium]
MKYMLVMSTLLLLNQVGFGADPFSQGDKVLSQGNRPALLVGTNTATGEQKVFNARGLDVNEVRRLARAGESPKRTEFERNAVDSFNKDANKLAGYVTLAQDRERPTSACYGFYWSWIPVSYVYFYRPIYYVTWSWTFTYIGYSWYFLY